MDNIILPTISPDYVINNKENGVSGQITNIPPEVQQALRVGQSYLLEILLTQKPTIPSTGQNTLLQGQILVDGQEFPIEMKLETPIELEVGEKYQIGIKIRENVAEQIPVKILSVNSKDVNKYNLLLNKPNPNIENVEIQDTSPVKISVPQTISKFHGLKIGQILKNIGTKINLPPTVMHFLEEEFSQAEINVALRKTVSAEIKSNLVQNPIMTEGESVKNVVGRLELILKGFTEQLHGKVIYKLDQEHFVNQIKNEFMSLKASVITGTAFSNSDNKVLALRTVLGNFLPEKVLKLENLSNVLLEIKDIKFPVNNMELNLPDLISSRELTSGLSELITSLKEVLQTKPTAEINIKAQDLLEIIKNLENIGQEAIAEKIIQKLPNLENGVLENMFKFVKGATQHKPEIWLGKDLYEEVKSLGAQGVEISNRLGEFLGTSIREGGTWKIINIPFLQGHQIEKIRIAIKNFKEEENKTNLRHKKSARFVVDTNFSRLGSFQFDGFSYVKDRQFDLIVRSSKNIDESIKSNIFKIFKTCLHSLHYKGTIKLNVKENFIKICDDKDQEETIKQGFYV